MDDIWRIHTHTHIHKKSDFLVVMISMGLAPTMYKLAIPTHCNKATQSSQTEGQKGGEGKEQISEDQDEDQEQGARPHNNGTFMSSIKSAFLVVHV